MCKFMLISHHIFKIDSRGKNASISIKITCPNPIRLKSVLLTMTTFNYAVKG